MWIYPVFFEPAEEGGFVVTFPDVPEAITEGDDETTALLMAEDALITMLDAYMGDGQPIPEPSPLNGHLGVALPILAAGKAALHNALLASGMTKAELARRLNLSLTQAERLFSLHHKSRIEQIETALALFGKRLVADVKEAA
ncbi:MAG: type II toxin-antitoxin system HicB family antitoxin [Methylococcaceae bacterium]|nr:type II toxin-antitoxin system HicB family antitoxin [Methylococcaceae bacterium]